MPPARYSLSTLEQKVDWLLQHPVFLKDKVDKKKLVAALKKDGLIAQSTYWSDINLEDAVRKAKDKAWRPGYGRP